MAIGPGAGWGPDAERRPWLVPLIICAVWGLSPYWPQPHLLEKLAWLQSGHPFRWLDAADLACHLAPWAWLAWALLRPPDLRPGL